MSVTVVKAEGVTVLTMNTDPQSSCPPLCQILGGLCCGPECCTVSQLLRKVQGTSQSVLGTLHIMVGLLTIGLGSTLVRAEPHYYWLGAMFVLFGIMSILSEKYPSPGLVILSVILNLAGVGFAIAAIVLHSISIVIPGLWWMCDEDYDYRPRYNTPSPREERMKQECLDGKNLILMIETGILALLIILSVLELCVAISSAVLGIKALKSGERKEKKSIDGPGDYKPLLNEVTSYPSV